MARETKEKCLTSTKSYINSSWCETVWDGFMCWPASAPSTIIEKQCPPYKGLDLTKKATRFCSDIGRWLDESGQPDNVSIGWTNFTRCISPEMQEIMDSVEKSPDEFTFLYMYKENGYTFLSLKMQIAEITRILEIVGYSISFLSLILSIFIMFSLSSLKSPKTSIHKNLFFALFIHVFTRLVIYIDQIIVKSLTVHGIDNSDKACLVFHIILEYTKTAFFAWFLVEGIYLNRVLYSNSIELRKAFITYYATGWGIPVVLVAIWACVMNFKLNTVCWSFYSMSHLYWILEGPRVLALAINTVFLISTLKIVTVKLKRSTTSRAQQILKSAKAAILLVPLLGLCNIFQMVKGPLDKSALEFGLWAFTSHFLTSFQGFFITLTYCFLNKRVRSTLRKKWQVFLTNSRIKRDANRARRASRRASSISKPIFTECTSIGSVDNYLKMTSIRTLDEPE